MSWSGKSWRTSILAVLLQCWLALPLTLGAFAAEPEPLPLQLEVFINDQKTELIGSFLQFADGRIATRRGELAELGIKVPGSGKDDDLVVLQTMAGVAYRYDEPTQALYFTLSDKNRVPRVYDFAGAKGEIVPVTAGYGAVLNYGLFASQSLTTKTGDFTFNGASASLDARVFSPFGTVSQTGILSTTPTKDFEALRLDSTFKHSDPSSLVTFTAGDSISGGLLWTRPIRFGGLQVQRNFGLRSDLITNPLPAFSGSAAVPSTVDVYIGNVKTFSQDVPAGPLQITGLPALSGGNARVVVRDSAGRQVESILPLFSATSLLRPGFSYFSLEAGYPRLNYGTLSADYFEDPFASASFRHGVSDWLTVETHAEYGAGLLNAGLGAVVRMGSAGVASLAASGSERSGDKGLQVFVSFDTQFLGGSLSFSTQRTFGDYQDLASVTALSPDPIASLILSAQSSPRPARTLDRLSIAVPLPRLKSSLGLSFVNLTPAVGPTSRVLSASWTRALPWNGQLFVTGFADFGRGGNSGVFAGMSMPIGERGAVSSSSIESGGDGIRIRTDLVKAMKQEVGSYGWRVSDIEGAGAYRSAAGSYRSSIATIEAGIEQNASSVGGSAEIDGGIATMGNGAFFTNRVDDSFAVVDVGAPNVEVSYENRPIGKTNAKGVFFVPNLRSYDKNKISIDPQGLPVDAEIDQTQDVVVPGDRSGVIVRFGVKTKVNSAIVIVSDKHGKALPVGSKGQLNDGADAFVVGYDGRAYLKDLRSMNTLTVMLDDAECRASFPYSQAKNRQVVIGPVTCQ